MVSDSRGVEAFMQNWMWTVIGLTAGGVIVGLIVVLMALVASRARR